jgi:CPA1 family monovalent cation:H+ antiporter
MNAFIFILIGLQMPGIIDEMSPEAIKSGLGYAVIIGGAIVLTLCMDLYLDLSPAFII